MTDTLKVNVTVSFSQDWNYGLGTQEATMEVPTTTMGMMGETVKVIAGDLFVAGLAAALKELAEKEEEE